MVVDSHTLLKNTNIKGLYVLIGHSMGGFTVRLYTSQMRVEFLGTGVNTLGLSRDKMVRRLSNP